MAEKFDLPNVRSHVTLAPFTTYKIGGPADYFIQANSWSELSQAVVSARQAKLPYFILGTGANILIGDKGFRGLVVLNRASHIEFTEADGQPIVSAESGATIAELINQAAAQGLSGLEHFTGIPSSVGGAIWQNLHFLSPDRTRTVFIEEVLRQAKVLLPNNQTADKGVAFFEFGYDDSILHHQEIVILQATFNLTPKPEPEIRAQMEANLQWRRQRQPQLDHFPSCGSVFQKIEGVGAGRLIDQAGLKGFRVGNIQISEQHANFLVNLGGGTASEVRQLISHIQAEVKAKTGYSLKPEIGFIGEF